MNPAQALDVAARLEQLGVQVRSRELREAAGWYERGGNWRMRRAAKRASRRKGRR